MNDLTDTIYNDKQPIESSVHNLPIDYTNHYDLEKIILFSFDEGIGYVISPYEDSSIDSPKTSKWLFNLMCIHNHKRIRK